MMLTQTFTVTLKIESNYCTVSFPARLTCLFLFFSLKTFSSSTHLFRHSVVACVFIKVFFFFPLPVILANISDPDRLFQYCIAGFTRLTHFPALFFQAVVVFFLAVGLLFLLLPLICTTGSLKF